MRALCIALAASLAATAGCGDGRTPLVIYSPHGSEMLGDCERMFELEHPKVDVRWFPMGAELGIERLRAEAANPQADLWWGGPAVIFDQAERESLLAVYRPSWHEHAPPGSYSEAGYWYATFQTVKVIGYNDEVLTAEQAPQDWDDLLDPIWRDKVIIRSPMESGTMKSIFAAMIYRRYAQSRTPEPGYDWLRQLDANTKAYAASPATLMMMIGRREGLVTMWDLTDILLQRRERNVPIGYVVPASGAVVLNEGMAVVRGASQKALAEEFYEFVTAKEELVRQAGRFFRIPARADIDPADSPEWLRSIDVTPMPVDQSVISDRREEWMRHWEQRIKGRS